MLIRAYIEWITRNRFLVIFLSLLALAVISFGITKLSFKTDLRIYFSKENPQVTSLDNIEKTYTKSDNVLFVLAPKNGVFNKEFLTIVSNLTEQSWKLPYSRRVDSITNFKHSHADGDDVMVDDLVLDVKQLDAKKIDYIRHIATNEPLLVNRAISPDGKVTGVNVTFNIPKGEELSSVPKIVAKVRELAATITREHPDVDVYLTGVVMMDNAFGESSQKDLSTLVPAMLVLCLVLMALMLRSYVASLAAFLVLTFSILVSMGMSGWMGVLLNPVSINAPNIILAISICNCLHLLLAYGRFLKKGLGKQEAMVAGMSMIFYALFLTSLTTVVGFLSMNFSEAPPFRDLGNMTSLGVIGAFVFSVTFLPAFMMLFPVPKAYAVKEGKDNKGVMQKIVDRVAEFIIAKPKVVVAYVLVLTVIASAGVFKNVFNDEFVKYFDKSVQFRTDTDFTASHLTGIYYIDYSLGAKTDAGISDPAYLASLDKFTIWLRQQPEVLHVNTITDIYKRLNMNMHGDDPAAFTLPQSADLAAQYLLLYEMSLPYGLDLRDRINLDKTATRVTATLKNLSSNEVIAFENRAQAWLHANGGGMKTADGTGLTTMFANIGMRNTESMVSGTLLAFVLIGAVLMVVFRSVKYGIISLLPNLLPAVMAFGLWGYLVGQIGLALSVMTAMTFGMIVDDTIHFVLRYLQARKEMGLNPDEAVRFAFTNVGVPIVVSLAVLAAGFGVLGFSSFQINAGMGILTALVIGCSLIHDILLTPALLLIIDNAMLKRAAAKKARAGVAFADAVPG
ncbi:efflux RND transporter permease subunit [Massilia sp. TSP1-1-2]|uniref:efflux RND transporter permease subunit n=1 Tax=Massilia sp. TSP1-1-2 TaxID=2804649 RepID=UPI003CF03B0C